MSACRLSRTIRGTETTDSTLRPAVPEVMQIGRLLSLLGAAGADLRARLSAGRLGAGGSRSNGKLWLQSRAAFPAGTAGLDQQASRGVLYPGCVSSRRYAEQT